MIQRILLIFLFLLWDFYIVHNYGIFNLSKDAFLWLLIILNFATAVYLFIQLVIDFNNEKF